MSIYTELTTEQMIQIQMDLMAERPVSVPGPAAAEFARRLRKQIDDIIIAGRSVEIPFEI